MTTETSPAPDATIQNSAPADSTPKAPEAAPAPPSLLDGDTSTTPKPEDGTTPQTEKKDEPPAPVVPEKYEFTLPEGMALDEALAGKFTPIAQKYKLTQEGANELATLYAEARQADVQAQADAWTKHVEGWREAVKADPEIGGQNYDKSLALAQTVVARFFGDKFKEHAKLYGYGNDPELIRGFAAIGKAMAEDAIHASGKPAAEGVKSAKDFYDNSNMN